ncbi:MAG: hydroxymethylbilane synthase, partial [Burkholderiales bacterium]
MVDRQGAGQLNTPSGAAPAGAVAVPPPNRLVIATRESRLALWQAHHVRDRLSALYPACGVELLGMTTVGDQILDRSLNEIGGKGLFTKELEVALADGRADLAVHSLKDVPMELPEGFALAAVTRREDPRDAFVSPRFAGLDALPQGARIGTSSLRRAAQLAERRPDLKVLPLRGNLDTRLRKLDAGEYDAIVLAAAGLKRLGLADRIREVMPPTTSLPAPGQGALGIEILSSRPDVRAWLAPLADRRTWLEVTAERSVSRALGGSCRIPLAAYAVVQPDGLLRLDALLATDGRVRRATVSSPAPVRVDRGTAEPEGVGGEESVAEARGAR